MRPFSNIYFSQCWVENCFYEAIIGHESLDIFPYKKYAESKQLKSFPLGEVKWLIIGIVLIHVQYFSNFRLEKP